MPAVHTLATAPNVIPYHASRLALTFDALAASTHHERYTRMAMLARAWFDGRNAAELPVYDRAAGRVYDGIDGVTVSRNCGAESNVEGALALFGSLPWDRYADDRVVPFRSN